MCRFSPSWNRRDYFNALKEEWSYFTVTNPPYSQTASFILKAVLEYRKGKNFVLIIPSISLENDDMKAWLNLIMKEIIPAIQVKFPPHKRYYNKAISVIGLI